MKSRLLIIIGVLWLALSASAQVTPTSQMEKLDRGLVAVPAQSKGVFLSWRLLGTDSKETRFNVIRDGVTIAAGLKGTNYVDATGTSDTKYAIETVGGPNAGKSANTKSWGAFVQDHQPGAP
jgi:rhamnogalacturonan endolyase